MALLGPQWDKLNVKSLLSEIGDVLYHLYQSIYVKVRHGIWFIVSPPKNMKIKLPCYNPLLLYYSFNELKLISIDWECILLEVDLNHVKEQKTQQRVQVIFVIRTAYHGTAGLCLYLDIKPQLNSVSHWHFQGRKHNKEFSWSQHMPKTNALLWYK